MSKPQRFSGPELAPLLRQVRAELGSDAVVLEANRVRSGGVAGFFTKEHFEVTAVAKKDPPGSRPRSTPIPASVADESDRGPMAPTVESSRSIQTALLDRADQVNTEEFLVQIAEIVRPDDQPTGTFRAALGRALDVEIVEEPVLEISNQPPSIESRTMRSIDSDTEPVIRLTPPSVLPEENVLEPMAPEPDHDLAEEVDPQNPMLLTFGSDEPTTGPRDDTVSEGDAPPGPSSAARDETPTWSAAPAPVEFHESISPNPEGGSVDQAPPAASVPSYTEPAPNPEPKDAVVVLPAAHAEDSTPDHATPTTVNSEAVTPAQPQPQAVPAMVQSVEVPTASAVPPIVEIASAAPVTQAPSAASDVLAHAPGALAYAQPAGPAEAPTQPAPAQPAPTQPAPAQAAATQPAPAPPAATPPAATQAAPAAHFDQRPAGVTESQVGYQPGPDPASMGRMDQVSTMQPSAQPRPESQPRPMNGAPRPANAAGGVDTSLVLSPQFEAAIVDRVTQLVRQTVESELGQLMERMNPWSRASGQPQPVQGNQAQFENWNHPAYWNQAESATAPTFGAGSQI